MSDNLQSIDFYQLTGGSVAELAAQLAEKCLSVGKKLIIYCEKDQSSDVSRALWTSQDQNFIAHAIDNADGAEFADIWISTDLGTNQISAEFAMCLSGLETPNMTSFERQFILFDGGDENALSVARQQWKNYAQTYQGKCRYFARTNEGRWEQKAKG